MATIAPPPPKRQRREEADRTRIQQDVNPPQPTDGCTYRFRFVDNDGKAYTTSIEAPIDDINPKNMNLLLNTLLGHAPEDFVRYRFGIPVPGTDTFEPLPKDLRAFLREHRIDPLAESGNDLHSTQEEVFKVQRATRLAHRIPGHGKAILCAAFSPETGTLLATGSGDHTAKIWDTSTGTPKHTLKGHSGWVFDVSWSPDGERLATCSQDKTVRVWNPKTGKQIDKEFRGHSMQVVSLAWEPYHLWTDDTPRLASSSRDHSVRIWIVNTGRTEHVLGGHADSVTCVKWGGTGLIYTASYDRTVIVWDARAGTLVHHLRSHVARINHLALSTDFVLRTGFFDHTKNVPKDDAARRAKARDRFEKAAHVAGKVSEKLVSASDDNTMFLWDPMNQGKKPVVRMLGHQNKVMHVSFSPDATLVASACWDKQIKTWDATDGKWLRTLRGHVGPVNQCAFSADSRLLATGSKDTTVKVWDVVAGKLVSDLPGHEDQVYAVDWSPDGQRVASGGEDKAVRLWRH